MRASELTNELIHAYLDGDIEADLRVQIAALLAHDPQALVRVQQQQQLRELLHATFDAADMLPAPQHSALKMLRFRIHRRQNMVRLSMLGMTVVVAMLLGITAIVAQGRASINTAAPNATQTPKPYDGGLTASPLGESTGTPFVATPSPTPVLTGPSATAIVATASVEALTATVVPTEANPSYPALTITATPLPNNPDSTATPYPPGYPTATATPTAAGQ